MALTWPAKEAGEVLNFEIDWSQRLIGSDTIVSSDLTILTGASVIDSQAFTTTTSTAFISGGTPGETVVVQAIAGTNAGLTLEETVILPIAAQEESYATEIWEVYQTAEDIDRYAIGSIGDAAAAWLGSPGQVKVAAAVAAARLIERQNWQGTLTVADQPLQWPRSGLKYPDGSTVDPTTVPQRVLFAVCEIAMQLTNGSDIQDVSSTFNYNRLLKAGSVEIEFFRQTDAQPRFPQVIQELIGFWLNGAGDIPLASSFGTRGRSIMGEQYDVNRGF